ncbi:SPOR domain-containing protein [Pelomonas sp. UHG3]|uniref:SPOR domain-containing protein n=1 Tax=Roseateles hydrophilus TaxID=2975054 RepID=A0ACC6C8K8_9BURK|nr:SPOR domain-containing protein [Pelomonas sp. UHG3]MCY4744751.1 SPOR domain-containing protein [Pelomonas sp. UHG3]
MGLFSFLKRDDAASTAAAPKKSKSGAKAGAADDVQVLRVRARRRLIGAAVLVAVGVVGFPLIFETQPRPIPVDLPIEIPRKEAAPPLAVPTREPLSAAEPAAVAASSPIVALPVEPRGEEKSVDRPAEKPLEKLAEKPVDKPPVEKPVVKAADKPPEKPLDKPKAASDGARAQALLDGKEPAAARYIVQVGAYGENKAAQEVRGKVEKLGLKTYAQAVETADGKRIRVRLGPFASRDEAERASAKLKSAGLPGAILTL